MATGTSWQHYYSGSCNSGAAKFGSSASHTMAHLPGMGMEYTSELHLKMSKKIAQLTKVIYTLNTRNDEHESGILALKDAHEEEIQQIITETREKIIQYKSKVIEELDLKKKIQVLEESLEEHTKVKHQALMEFEAYKRRVEDMQLYSEAQHVQRIVTMSREVEEMRKKFEERLQSFMQLQVQCEKDKHITLEELKTAHAVEMQAVLKTHQNQKVTLTHDKQTHEEVHQMEMEELHNRIEELHLEKTKLIEDYESKLGKAKVFYDQELEALKRSQLFTAESLHSYKQKEAEMKKDFQNQEALLQKNLGNLKSEFQVVQGEAETLREKCQKLQENLTTAENKVQVLQKELEDVKQGDASLQIKHKELESELVAARDRLQQQTTELVLKASHIGMLQTTQITQEATIKDLESEKSRIKEKISRLEEERALLQSKNQNLDEKQRQQILALEKKINEAKETQRDCYEKEIISLQNKFELETLQLNEAHAKGLEELSWKHQTTLETAHSTANKDKKKLHQELQQQFEKEKKQLEENKNQLQQQLENVKEELTAKLTAANQEVCHLQDLVRKNEQGLGSAEGHIFSLKEAQDRLQKELDLTRSRLRETSDSLFNIQKTLDQERKQHEETLSTLCEEERLKLDKMSCDLEVKWTENLRQECTKLHEELNLQHDEDKKSYMTQLVQLKDREINVARESWQKKVEDLLDQISLLKQNLEMQLCQSQTSLQQLQSQFSQERQRLAQELHELEEEHQKRQKSLQEAHLIAFQTMEETKEQEQKKLQDCLQQKHSEELQSLKDSQRKVMEAFRLEMEQELQTLRFELEDEGKALLASLRSDLNRQHAAVVDQLRHNHQQEMAVVTVDLERSIEHSREQEKKCLSRISDLQDELKHRDHHISDLDKSIVAFHENINTLTKELEFKGNEILRIRSDANQQIRMHEQDLNKKHEEELDELTTDHIRGKQSMLADFNKTQELLTEINSALQISLKELEEKYQNRESRPEDLQLIAELKDMIAERDQLIKKLIDDKKFYQLELVNRETNFNKLFNANPNVGIINPLVKQKKKNDKSANRFVSAPNLSAMESSGVGNGHPTRLEPIPNSPIHDIEFKSSKPLPQPMAPKTYLSPHQTEAVPDPQRQEWFARYFTF
uniref:Protein FAM184A isoform X2 n=1 Tax=Geotrypetes seraphini TaxID=260995 RepID=A0A6P8R332_GEOSA|nr:protein FAM184A isoform X2 [Geotrypetes seraphini]